MALSAARSGAANAPPLRLRPATCSSLPVSVCTPKIPSACEFTAPRAGTRPRCGSRNAAAHSPPASSHRVRSQINLRLSSASAAPASGAACRNRTGVYHGPHIELTPFLTAATRIQTYTTAGEHRARPSFPRICFHCAARGGPGFRRSPAGSGWHSTARSSR